MIITSLNHHDLLRRRPLLENRILPQVGHVQWMGRAAERKGPIEEMQEIRLEEGSGIVGDHHANGRRRSKRQVTLIQAEHLPVISALSKQPDLHPSWLRRNLVVSGIPLLALVDKEFRIGGAVLAGTGLCDPCHLMEERLGSGGYNAMLGHGGITAVVLCSGTVKVGDPVRLRQD